ncbi:hypothetical protein ACIPSE_13125 [Streptomyces sp. NPDC090106]|uniref:hypothetical protein n=1 Tax=Streptomyces sp. NPDC090106 TaxID=3365946 RepID=UPI0038212E43
MTCRTRLDAGHGRRRRSSCSRSGPGSLLPASPQHALAGPADLVVRVAAIVPVPGDALGADDDAWEAFNAFMDEAARLLTELLGDGARQILRTLLDSPLSEDAVTGLLIERALGGLRSGDR